MIDIKTDEGVTQTRMIAGTLEGLMADCGMIMLQVYKVVNRQSPEMGEFYKRMMNDGTYIRNVLKMFDEYDAMAKTQKENKGGMFELQKLMAYAAKGGDHAAD